MSGSLLHDQMLYTLKHKIFRDSQKTSLLVEPTATCRQPHGLYLFTKQLMSELILIIGSQTKTCQIIMRYHDMDMLSIVLAPDSKVHEANMGTIWGQQDPGGPHVGRMNLAIWGPMSAPDGPHVGLMNLAIWGYLDPSFSSLYFYPPPVSWC